MLQAATPGVTISSDGTEGRRTEGVVGEQTLTIWRDGLTILATASPGALFGPDAGDTADVPIEVVGTIADSLAPAPADDPRLTEYAFDEETVDHP